ncbi:MAG TPA: energy transducer TonB [Pyrinomonadaceae bacterium]|nr:energy transducer TonB [Pyrinomonadaceae bacterium]
MEKHLTRLFAFAFAVVFIFSAVGNGQDRDVKAMPAVSIPEAAAAEGLYGTMLVEVKLDDAGKVKNIKQIVGPDWTCPNYESPGMTALNDYVRNRAETATIDSGGKSHLWLEFKFVDPRPAKSKPEEKKLTGPKTVNAGVVNGKAVHLVQPRFPSEQGIRSGGKVEIKVFIDENGTVRSAEILSGNPILANQSRAAACLSKFSPTLLKGEPVKVSGVIKYSFLQ